MNFLYTENKSLFKMNIYTMHDVHMVKGLKSAALSKQNKGGFISWNAIYLAKRAKLRKGIKGE